MRLSLVQLRYLVAVAEHGSITTAARAVHISQSAVSSALAQLEETLGRAIFERSRGEGLKLTPFGAQVLQRARTILWHSDELLSLAEGANSKLSGSCRLACYWYLAPICMAPITRRWQQLYPNCELVPFFAGFGEVAEALQSGRVDVALTYNIGLTEVYEVRPLRDLLPRAVLPSGHPLASLQTVSLSDLTAHTMVVVDDPIGKDQILSLFATAAVQPGKIVYANSFEMMCSLIGNGVGWGIVYLLPSLTTSYDGRRLITRPISDNCAPVRIAVYARPGEEERPQIKAFAGLAESYLTERLAT